MQKETGLIFSTEMALANIQHKKTMTRRTRGLEKINEHPDRWAKAYCLGGDLWRFVSKPLGNPEGVAYSDTMDIKCPFGQVGDGIWQRETFRIGEYSHKKYAQIIYRAGGEKTYFGWNDWLERNARYAASNVGDGERWRSPLFMPRFASRFTPPITELRAERLQDITEQDAKREGLTGNNIEELIKEIGDDPILSKSGFGLRYPPIVCEFALLWDSLNAKRGYGWDLNKWVWVAGYENG